MFCTVLYFKVLQCSNCTSNCTSPPDPCTSPPDPCTSSPDPCTEVGPFVYKAVTVKDSVNSDGSENLVYGEDGRTLTYRPR